MDKLYAKCTKTYKDLSKNEEKLEKKKQEYYALNDKQNQENYNKAVDEAFNFVIDGAEAKILERSKYGFYNANLIKFKKNDNVKFNDITLFSLLYHDKSKESVLLTRLREHFGEFRLYKKVFTRSNSCILEVNWKGEESD